ncbi:MAG: succinylglutamate desuccinylase/aspartoacylase family protein [Rhodospirillales bacterium]|nr:succinylglutamate desuccinylase/aspartoacylase family protein [Rhodospirillales bacterium]
MCPVLKNDYPVELSPPDISPHRRGNTGIDYVTTFDSGVAGPHVMITALVHGNEICGAMTLDYLFREGVRPTRGKLTLAFVNIDAFSRFDPNNPIASRLVDEDFNRLWSEDVLDSSRDSVELRRARTLRPIVNQVDLLLDIHSMQHATAPLAMCGPLSKGRALARGVGIPEIGVVDSGHAAGKRMRDYAGFGDERSPKNALLVECGQHWEKSSADVAREAAIRFLLHAKVVDPRWGKARMSTGPLPKQRFIEVTGPVTIETDDFRFAADYRGLEVIPKAGTVIGHDGNKAIATPYDDCVLVMPSRRLLKGQSAVRFGRYA